MTGLPPWIPDDWIPPAKAAKAAPRIRAVPTIVRPRSRSRSRRRFPPAWLGSLGAGVVLALAGIWIVFLVGLLWFESASLEDARRPDNRQFPGARPDDLARLPLDPARAMELGERQRGIDRAFIWLAGASLVLIAALFFTAGITWLLYFCRDRRDTPSIPDVRGP